MASAKIKVEVLPHKAITVDGKLVEAGAVVAVSAAEAKTLEAEGYATKAA